LLVEPVSQAAANQRAGRCGRVANGICIRLYDEADFQSRSAFTDPEILRSSLAGVILRMKSLHLGDVVNFPFLEAPSGRAIADGYQLLAELGAVDEQGVLLPMGQALSRLPLDPRVARMIVEARERGALAEVLVIASALSVQDVRDRPLEAHQQADQQHAKFDDEKSEFSGYLRLWKWLQDARGGKVVAKTRKDMALQAAPSKDLATGRNAAFLPVAQRSTGATAAVDTAAPLAAFTPQDSVVDDASHKLSNRQWEQLLRQNFINIRRVREWRDIHSQLLTVVKEQRWPMNMEPAGYEAVHLSMLSGLLGNIGFKTEEGDGYLGARGIRFHPHPGAHLSKKPGRWTVAAELVETSRLYGRGLAAIEPQWLEQVGAHLLRKQLLDPHWEKKQGEVAAYERATLYGLVVYSQRRISYGKIDPQGARDIFIRQALVEGDWETRLPFLQANQKLIAKVEELEHKSRRQDVLVDDALIYAFYDQQIPQDICTGRALERWVKDESAHRPDLLRLSRDELMRHEAAGITTAAFPKIIKMGGVDCSATYLHQPGDPRDGVTVNVPLFVLNQVSEERAEWLVPGMLKDKIQALLKSLPQRPRSRFVPLAENAQRLTELLGSAERFGAGSLVEVLLKQTRDETSLDIKRADFKLDMLSPHLFMNFRITDEHGRQLGQGRNLGALKAQWGAKARGAFQALAGLKLVPELEAVEKPTPQAAAPSKASAKAAPAGSPAAPGKSKTPAHAADQRWTDWGFGALPELMEIKQGNQTLIGFPALIDHGTGVGIEVFDEPEVAASRHALGLRRLFALQIRDALKYLEKNIPDLQKMAVGYMPLGTQEELREQIINVAIDRAFLQEPLPADAEQFKQRVQDGRGRLTLIANEVARMASGVLQEYMAAVRKIKDSKNAPEATADAQQQLQKLVPKNFIAIAPWAQLGHYARYLKAITARLDKYRADPARDAAKLKELQPLEQRYWRLVAERKGQVDARMQEYRWMLEELRVSFFAQELRTPYPVSSKRLDKVWQQLQQ
jgi:ATP-dependent helicase HrpA